MTILFLKVNVRNLISLRASNKTIQSEDLYNNAQQSYKQIFRASNKTVLSRDLYNGVNVTKLKNTVILSLTIISYFRNKINYFLIKK